MNFYLIKQGEKYIAIDAGYNKKRVAGELEKLNVNPADVKAVLLTHSDGDHVASLELFTNAVIYLAKEEEQMINGETARFPMVHNKISREEYNLIEDQDTFYIGDLSIKAILTPGHTPGSVSYQINDKYLFIGDLLSINDGKIGRFNNFFNMDSEQAAVSIGKITKLPDVEYIFTGHYGFSPDYKAAVKEWEP